MAWAGKAAVMEWKEVGLAVKKFAPLLGTVLGGPAGGAVGGAVSLLCSAFGLEADAPDPAQVLAQIQMDPQWQVKLAEIEASNRIELSRLALEQDRAYLADRQGARAADVEKTRATGQRDWAMYLLAGIVVAGFFGLTWRMMSHALPEGSNEAVFMLFGGLNTSFASVIGYFFGSSKGSSDKTMILAGKHE